MQNLKPKKYLHVAFEFIYSDIRPANPNLVDYLRWPRHNETLTKRLKHPASEMTSIVSGGALNSTQTQT